MTIDDFICDPTVRQVGKPIAGRVIGTLVGAACGCGAADDDCTSGEKSLCTLIGAGLGYAVGAAWDAHCERAT